MDILIVVIWAIPYILWMAVIHLLFSVLFGNRLNEYKLTYSVIIVMELVIDFFFAIFYFEGILSVITNFTSSLFKN
jgi:hypothetical protein